MDAITESWVRNESDRLAVAKGCWFDESRGAYTVWWIERYCRLYEGEWAKQHILLRSGFHEVDQQIANDWDSGGLELSIARAQRYCEWIKNGGQPDWQYECTMRMFGWVRHSERWGRTVRRFNAASIYIPKKQKKALALDTPIPTPDGWTTVKDIRVGDMLFDVNGERCRVIDKTETYYNRPCYRVEFSNGEAVVCDEGHLWVTTSIMDEESKGSIRDRVRCHPERVRATKEIYESLFRKDGAKCHSIKMPKPFNCIKKDLPIEPYVFGVWLGDGDSDASRLTVSKNDYQEFKTELAAAGTVLRGFTKSKTSNAGRAGIGEKWGDFRTKLKSMRVFNNKHIPTCYLRASFNQRLALLQGLMDTDGHASIKNNMLVFATSSDVLKDNFAELLSSLGIKFKVRWYEKNRYWRFQFVCHKETLPAFRLPRKLKHQPTLVSRVMSARSRSVQISNIVPVDSVPVQCIAIDSPTKQFLFGKTMLPTHNTPTLAAWGVYLTCGDGEEGAKCFGGAKDGNQAGIAMSHAIAMIEQSSELASECKINRNEKSIEHVPTRSKYKPLSSANERHKESKEGINGNILIDETHVVDRDFVKIISRAGISRAEPFHIEVSTAGNNPDGYGKERQDYARQVVAGAINDPQLFVAIYEAPQSLSDTELASDPIKYGRMANPAWGHTAHEEEFLADYERSRRTISGLADFKMYRLNIWQHTSSQWLRLDQWLACGEECTLEELAGKATACGLDLSKTRDMSALSIAIPVGNRVNLFCKLWMTESYIEANKDKADFQKWVECGDLVQIPGDTIQEQFIRDEFDRLAEMLDIKILIKDRALAADFTEWIEDEHGKILQADYPQNSMLMEKPIDDFEAAVIDRVLCHDNNLCLNWQAGHASVQENSRGWRIIKKPKKDDYRKVDGMVASVMALWGTKQLPKRSSVYKRRGVLTA